MVEHWAPLFPASGLVILSSVVISFVLNGFMMTAMESEGLSEAKESSQRQQQQMTASEAVSMLRVLRYRTELSVGTYSLYQ